jgi:DNA alkylation damage repair protein AlkB
MELGDGSEFRKAEKCIRKMILVSKTIKKKRACRKVRGVIGSSLDSPFDLSTVVDYRENCTCTKEVLIPVSCRALGMESARAIKIEGAPEGFYIIAGALSTSEQLSLAKIALEEYSTAEHTNLSNLSKLSEDKSRPTDATIEAVINNCSQNIWLETLKDNDSFERFKALRWASLGYHYDWTKRMYQESVKSGFPPKLAALCRQLSCLIGENMVPEAAIVNYYPVGTYMSGHLDDAEHAMEEPIVSISLGTPAIFLLGGRTKNKKPIPILIKSGDVIIMAKDSRYSYHGVPAVMSHGFFETLKARGTMSPSSSSGLSGCLNRAQHDENVHSSDTDRRHFCCSICKMALTLTERCRHDDSELELYGAYTIEEAPQECSSSQERSIPHTALRADTAINKQADTYAVTDLEIEIDSDSLTESDTVTVNDSMIRPDSDPDPGPNIQPDPGSDSDPGPVLQYLLQGRININVRRVARPDTQWEDKCGSGASYNP